MFNKKGNSKYLIIISIFIFEIVVVLLYTAYGESIIKYRDSNNLVPEHKGSVPSTYVSANGSQIITFDSNIDSDTGMKSVFKSFITGFKDMPVWVNLLLFLAPIIIALFLIVSMFIPFIPG